ncbi:hypothetical protein J7643_01780 [bacterium]|nr:hypothetical protein [bacterium]
MMGVKTGGRQTYEDLLARLERIERDSVDERLLNCLKAVGSATYQDMVNRAGAMAATIRERVASNYVERDMIEVLNDECEQTVLQFCLLNNEGVSELDLFRYVTFAMRKA